MEQEILDLINRYWKFDDNQHPVSTWHDKQDLLEAVKKAVRNPDSSGWMSCDVCGCKPNTIYTTNKGRFCANCMPKKDSPWD